MKNVNPLLLQEISNRTLLKKRKLYSPEQWAKMMAKLQKVGKGREETTDKILKRAGVNLLPKGGLHTADEYGKRMIAGQTKRAQKLAKKYGRKLEITNSPNAGGSTLIRFKKSKPDEILYAPGNQSARFKPSDMIGVERKTVRKLLRKPSNKTLDAADTLSHEVDEYSIGHKLKNKLKPDDLFADLTYAQSVRSSHFPGVLDREAKRAHKLRTLYPTDFTGSYVRDRGQFARNKTKYVLNSDDTIERLTQSKNPLVRKKALNVVNSPEYIRRQHRKQLSYYSKVLEPRMKDVENSKDDLLRLVSTSRNRTIKNIEPLLQDKSTKNTEELRKTLLQAKKNLSKTQGSEEVDDILYKVDKLLAKINFFEHARDQVQNNSRFLGNKNSAYMELMAKRSINGIEDLSTRIGNVFK